MFIATLPPPVDMVAVAYVRDDTYKFTVTNETRYGEDSPCLTLLQGNRVAFGCTRNHVIVPSRGTWSVTVRFSSDGKWMISGVDSTLPGNADTELGEYAQRWNHLRYLYVR